MSATRFISELVNTPSVFLSKFGMNAPAGGGQAAVKGASSNPGFVSTITATQPMQRGSVMLTILDCFGGFGYEQTPDTQTI